MSTHPKHYSILARTVLRFLFNKLFIILFFASFSAIQRVSGASDSKNDRNLEDR